MTEQIARLEAHYLTNNRLSPAVRNRWIAETGLALNTDGSQTATIPSSNPGVANIFSSDWMVDGDRSYHHSDAGIAEGNASGNQTVVNGGA